MKFRCEREALAEAFGIASRAATSRTGALPVLSGLRLQLTGNQLSITGSDLDLTIQTTLEVAGDTDGGAVILARLASDIVRSLASGAVDVVIEGEEVSISNGRSHFTVRPLTLDDYPKLVPTADSAVVLPAEEFGRALGQVVRAASNDEARLNLTGVMFAAEGTGLRMVATDSYRLAVRDLLGQQVLAAEQKVLVPHRALTELQRLVGGVEQVTMRLGDREATFEVGTTRLTTRLIENEFPNYRQLIPASHPNTLTVEREPLLEAIRRVKILAKDATPVRLQMGGDVLRLSAISQEWGNASEELDAQFAGNEVTVAFNPEYLAAGVEACQGDSITLSTIDAMKPAVLRGAGHQDYLYLLMPVRVPN